MLHRLKISTIHEKGFNAKFFRAAFAVTVFKYQGSTIDEPYNIYDTDAKIKGEDVMSRNELYTALTRGTVQ